MYALVTGRYLLFSLICDFRYFVKKIAILIYGSIFIAIMTLIVKDQCVVLKEVMPMDWNM